MACMIGNSEIDPFLFFKTQFDIPPHRSQDTFKKLSSSVKLNENDHHDHYNYESDGIDDSEAQLSIEDSSSFNIIECFNNLKFSRLRNSIEVHCNMYLIMIGI